MLTMSASRARPASPRPIQGVNQGSRLGFRAFTDRRFVATFRACEALGTVLCDPAHLRTLQWQKNSCSAESMAAYSDCEMVRGAAPDSLPVRA
jgi:hypothetical protein